VKRGGPGKLTMVLVTAAVAYLLYLILTRRRQLDPPGAPSTALDFDQNAGARPPQVSTGPTPQVNAVPKPPRSQPDDVVDFDHVAPPPPIASLAALNAQFDDDGTGPLRGGGGGQSGGAGADRTY
jgi:hypothetical protein